MGFPWQEYWSCHFLLQGIFLTQGLNPCLLNYRFFTIEPSGKPLLGHENLLISPPRDASQVVLVVKNLPANEGDIRYVSLIPGLGRSSEEGNDNPLQYSCLENPVDLGA